MNNHEFTIILILTILTCLLLLALAVAAFYIGFCIGDSDNRKSVTVPTKQKHKKRKPPDVNPGAYINELNNLASMIDSYDGRAPVVKKDGDKI